MNDSDQLVLTACATFVCETLLSASANERERMRVLMRDLPSSSSDDNLCPEDFEALDSYLRTAQTEVSHDVLARASRRVREDCDVYMELLAWQNEASAVNLN